MHVYHLVAASNVDGADAIIDPAAVRHGTLGHGHITALAGPIDPLTHLNLDFADHRLGPCIVVAALTVGAAARFTTEGFALAYPQRTAFAGRGPVDQGRRRLAWQQALQTNP